MKYWLSHLPLEVWVDCYRYPWITRKELGRIVHRFRNRKFAEYLQFYLHDWGKRTMRTIYFRQRPSKAIPLTPLPSNIRAFQYIQIKHFDQQTINFLHRIQPLLLANTKFDFSGIEPSNLGNLRLILDHIVPLLGKIDELECKALALPTVGQCFGNKKLAQINWIQTEAYGLDEAETQATINFLISWLTSSAQQDGIAGPKLCDISLWDDNGFSKQIRAAIREDFLAAKSPSTFAFYVHHLFSQWEFAEFHLQNGIGEELHGVRIGRYNNFKITRHKPNCGTELKEWVIDSRSKGNNGGHFQNLICIQSPTIGPVDAAMDGPVGRR